MGKLSFIWAISPRYSDSGLKIHLHVRGLIRSYPLQKRKRRDRYRTYSTNIYLISEKDAPILS
jgi:hypothetical protein